MLLRLYVPSSFFTVSALFRLIIGVSLENLLIAIKFITSQSQFLGVRMAESLSVVPEIYFEKLHSLVFLVCSVNHYYVSIDY